MNLFSSFVITHRKTILIIFLLLTGISLCLFSFVSVNYNMEDYLPQDSQSTKAIEIMAEEFDEDVPNARVMVTDVTIIQTIALKEEISSVPGVNTITWLDDVLGAETLKGTPIEFLDESIVNLYYKDSNALFSVSIESGEESKAMAAIYDLLDTKGFASGQAVDAAATQDLAVTEVVNAMAILVPFILIALLLTTASWFEPLLFLLTIGIAVVINMGSNVILGEVSFITQTVSPILQLAVSLDYAIFLLHSFGEYRDTHAPREAMRLAMKRSLPTVAASAATTIIGFSALLFMRFRIGSDLGINLVKGVALSFISVMVFLPVLTLMCDKLIDKTKHKRFIPSVGAIGKGLIKVRIPFLILALIVVIPCFLAQSNTPFMYGMGGVAEGSKAGADATKIEEYFGKENTLVLLVPNASPSKEASLCDDLKNLPHVTSVVSYTTAVGKEIPSGYVPQQVTDQFYSENFARIIIYTDTSDEGDAAFATVESILSSSKNYYDTYYLTGQSAALLDMRDVVSVDMKTVNLVAIAGIFIVILLTFRSLLIPVFLVFTIETAIWINLSVAYFTDNVLSFVGYLIINTVQLGATVDYAILLTNHYLSDRRTLKKKDAMQKTLAENLIAILTSASILSSAGFILAATSSNPIVSELGTLLGRGTILSFVMVVCALPAMLMLLDNVIQKTTLAPNAISRLFIPLLIRTKSGPKRTAPISRSAPDTNRALNKKRRDIRRYNS